MIKILFVLFTVILFTLIVGALFGSFIVSLGAPIWTSMFASLLVGFFLPTTLFRWIYQEEIAKYKSEQDSNRD